MKSWRKTICLDRPLRGVTPGKPVVDIPPALTRADVEAARKAGHEAGRAEAEKALGEQLVRQRTELGALALGVIESLKRAVPQVVHDTEQHLVALALDIAHKLVTDIPVTAEMVQAAVGEALVEVEGASEVHVRLNPEDLELLRKSESSLLVPTAQGAQVQFHAASEVSRGGCVVQTRFGVIDGRRETRLELLKRSLLE
jgi:flagellar biosynthesis/type III secretory pathway protein FliH